MTKSNSTNHIPDVELLHCPFCGGGPEFDRIGTRNQSCIISCQDCGCSLETGEVGSQCGKRWNIRAALQSRDNHADDWFDTFMELARAVVLANRIFAVCPTTTKQKAAAEAAIALQEHARKRPALQSQDREDSERLDWIERNARRDPDMNGNHTWWPTSFNKTIHGPSLREAIDHARRVEEEAT